MVYDLAKIQDSYYLYALLPYKERNYTLIIKNAHYYEVGQEKKQDLKFDFSVSGNISSFSVNPGFVITDKDFTIKARSNIKTITLQAEFVNSTQDFTISSGQEKRLRLDKILFSGLRKLRKPTYRISQNHHQGTCGAVESPIWS